MPDHCSKEERLQRGHQPDQSVIQQYFSLKKINHISAQANSEIISQISQLFSSVFL
jgi:hypothetical protein